MNHQDKKKYLESKGYCFNSYKGNTYFGKLDPIKEGKLDEYIENEKYCDLIDKISKRQLKKIISTWRGSASLGRNFVYWVQDRVREYLKEAICGYQGVYGDRMEYLRNGLNNAKI
jgi:hypothetical protein